MSASDDSGRRIRILSDLHLGHAASQVRKVSQLEPLLEGADEIIFNGDSCEQKVVEWAERGRDQCAELVELCSRELRSAAGFSTVNLVKRRGNQVFPYKQLLIDVADRLAPGSTPLSWTKYRLRDSSSEEDIENHVLELFEERVRGWWAKLPDKKREKYVNGINSVLSDAQEGAQAVKKRATPILQQQGIESLIQTGLISGLSKLSAGGLLGVAGVTLVGQMGWLILVQTVGWMAGLKIAVFGIGGYGAFGGAVVP